MTASIIFTTPGRIDLSTALVSGFSTKASTDPKLIGRFGTGLKYAIACILRWGGSIVIDIAGERHTFTTRPATARDVTHDIIHHVRPDGTEHSINVTTHYGINWEPWMVLRELHSNTLDEGGTTSYYQSEPSWSDLFPDEEDGDHTCIIVRGDKLTEAYSSLATTFISPSRKPIYSSSTMEIYNGPSEYLYYRGVRVCKFKSLLTYNMLEDIDLTEERQLSGTFAYSMRLRNEVQRVNDMAICRTMLTHFDNHIEATATPTYLSPAATDKFKSTVLAMWKENRTKFGYLRDLINEIDPSLSLPTAAALTPFQQKMYDRALNVLAQVGVDTSICPIDFTSDLGKDCLGAYYPKAQRIFLSTALFKTGTKSIVSTLFEELLHAKSGMTDLTYEMQTHLFDTIVSLWEEHIIQEPI